MHNRLFSGSRRTHFLPTPDPVFFCLDYSLREKKNITVEVFDKSRSILLKDKLLTISRICLSKNLFKSSHTELEVVRSTLQTARRRKTYIWKI